MKLKASVTIIPYDEDFIIMDTAPGSTGRKMLKTNETGARIVQLLADGTCDSTQTLVEVLTEEYDADAETIRESVSSVLACLRENGMEEGE